MEPYGALWSPMVPYGALWSPMEPYGAVWIPIEPYEALWNPMEPYGALHNLMEPYGGPLPNPLEPYIGKYTTRFMTPLHLRVKESKSYTMRFLQRMVQYDMIWLIRQHLF
jgi:hypothetical protein